MSGLNMTHNISTGRINPDKADALPKEKSFHNNFYQYKVQRAESCKNSWQHFRNSALTKTNPRVNSPHFNMKGTSEKWRKFCQQMAPCNFKSLRGSLTFFSSYSFSHSQVAFTFYDIYMIKFYFLSFLRSIKDQFPTLAKKQLDISTWLVLTGLKPVTSPAELAYNPHTQPYLQCIFKVLWLEESKIILGIFFPLTSVWVSYFRFPRCKD